MNRQNQEQHPQEMKVLEEIFPKPEQSKDAGKKKEKSKNIVDKSGLLGDLKSFAKNFKMPPSNTGNET